jgi:hypothetical protein
MAEHAKLSASSSHRWLACPPSVNLCEQYPDTGSQYAAEGSSAHQLAEYKLRCALGEDMSEVADIREHLNYYNEEMESRADDYAAYILEIIEHERQAGHNPQIFIEQRVDYSRYVPEGFGTCDAVIVSDGTLYIVDFKYGKGVKVEAKDNSQLKIYALGALEHFGMLYDIKVVSMIIFQPRLENVSDDTVFVESLIQWAEDVLIPTARLAESGGGEFKSGEHCRFCKIKAECRERAKANMALAAYDFADPALLENDEIASILGKVDDLVSWAGDIKDFALQQALKGVVFDGFKVVEGRSNRRYTDESAVAETVTAAGHDPYEKSILGITKMESLLGKKQFAALLGGLVEKPTGKPVLVVATDRRQAIQVNTAAQDFEEPIADHYEN